MFSTPLATAALAGLLASGSLATPPAWQTDYRKALVQAQEQQKPVAVFIARGGTAQLVRDGLGTEAVKLLRQNYVCLQIDTATPAGKELAASFRLNEGLVISDRTGGLQALRHEGAVSRDDLTRYLTRYAETATVTQTEYAGAAQPVAPAPVYAQPVYPQPYSQPRPILNALGNARMFFGGG